MRVVQRLGTKGSLKWIQRAVNGRAEVLDAPILAAIPGASRIEWRSPLAGDDHAEYRDRAFLERVGAGDLAGELAGFWPSRGPQWDALGVTDQGDILLVEAKANLPEFHSPATQAGPVSRALIDKALAETAGAIGCVPAAPWAATHYQYANRLAHLWFLRSRGRKAWLVLVNFLGDAAVNGPEEIAAWEAEYYAADAAMGLPERHALSPFMIHLHPHVGLLG